MAGGAPLMRVGSCWCAFRARHIVPEAELNPETLWLCAYLASLWRGNWDALYPKRKQGHARQTLKVHPEHKTIMLGKALSPTPARSNNPLTTPVSRHVYAAADRRVLLTASTASSDPAKPAAQRGGCTETVRRVAPPSGFLSAKPSGVSLAFGNRVSPRSASPFPLTR